MIGTIIVQQLEEEKRLAKEFGKPFEKQDILDGWYEIFRKLEAVKESL